MDPEKKEEKIETPVNDESELDKALENSINEVKAGKVLAPEKVEDKPKEPEAPKEETPKEPETPKEGDDSKPQAEASKEGEYSFRVPNKGKFESDESYEKRIELMDLVKRRKLAKTDEQKQELSEKIDTAKSQLKNINGTDKITNPLLKKSGVEVKKDETPLTPEEETLKADRERLKQLGGTTKEEVQELLQQERLATEVTSTLEKFVDRHTELKDADVRDVFFDFVNDNYAWQGKTGKALMTILELARESMFKPQETIQERVLKGADVQNKVNAMQFPGGTVAKTDLSPEVRESVEELKKTGMSEEKALELISE
jgi:hypothetical protein